MSQGPGIPIAHTSMMYDPDAFANLTRLDHCNESDKWQTKLLQMKSDPDLYANAVMDYSRDHHMDANKWQSPAMSLIHDPFQPTHHAPINPNMGPVFNAPLQFEQNGQLLGAPPPPPTHQNIHSAQTAPPMQTHVPAPALPPLPLQPENLHSDKTMKPQMNEDEGLYYYCHMCKFSTIYGKYLQKHFRVVHEVSLELSDIRQNYSCSSSSVIKPIKETIYDGNDYLNCTVFCDACGFGTSKEQYLIQHQKAAHGIIMSQGKAIHIDNLDSKEIFYCTVEQCSYKTGVKSHLQRHIYSVHGSTKKIHKCEECNYTTPYASSIKSHKLTVHQTLKPFSCQICGVAFKIDRQLRSHIRSKHLNLRPYVCQICNHATTNKTNLRLHIERVHHNLKPHVCELCEYASNSSSHLRRHVNTVHNNDHKFFCDFCTFSCKTSVSLHNHVKSTHKPFNAPKNCKLCNYSSIYPDHLQRHINSFHNKDRPYKCVICSMCFSSKSNLSRHQEARHKPTSDIKVQKPRPHICSLCSYNTDRKSYLNRHIQRDHPGIEKFACVFCTFTADQNSTLVDHVRNDHEPSMTVLKCDRCFFNTIHEDHFEAHVVSHKKRRPFKCKLCVFESGTKLRLMRHMEALHKSAFDETTTKKRRIRRCKISTRKRKVKVPHSPDSICSAEVSMDESQSLFPGDFVEPVLSEPEDEKEMVSSQNDRNKSIESD